LPRWAVIGFTGHRDIRNPDAVRAKIGSELDELAANCGPLVTVSSAAVGGDLLFLEEAARRKIPRLIVLPFPQKQFANDFSPEEWQRILPHLNEALQVEEVFAPAEEAYLEASERTIEQADVVLAVWDGNDAAGPGGTGDAVSHARLLGKPLIWINPATLQVVSERLELLQPAKPSAASDCPPREKVEKYFAAADDRAIRRAPQTRHLMLYLILVHLAATSIGTSIVIFDWGRVAPVLAAVECLLLGISFFITSLYHHKHHEWRQRRTEAEICRSVLETWDIRSQFPGIAGIALEGYDSLCRSLRLLHAMDKPRRLSLQETCRNFLDRRIREQTDYFVQRTKQARRALARLQFTAMCSTTLAALLTAVIFGMMFSDRHGAVFHGMKFLSLVLPLLSATCFSVILANEYGRRSERYTEMVSFLEFNAKRLATVKTWSGLARIVSETEDVLLREIIEWHSFKRFTEKLH